MQSQKTIEEAIKETIKEVTGISDLDKDSNLVYLEIGIAPASFLYIFDILAKKLKIDIYEILKTRTYEVMTINNLAKALYELQHDEQV